MKKLILSLLTVSSAAITAAQMVTDTVSLGPGYSNMAWYSLENDEQANVTKSDWDIAFQASSMGSTVRINPATGTRLWRFPGDTSQFATLDTAGMSGWTELFDADTSWSYGAFSQDLSGGSFDIGWGTYSMITHTVTGDELYVIELSNGQYQKIWIENLISGEYTFRHATLDNMMDMTHTVDKSNYPDKNFVYYSLQNHNAIDKEPAVSTWDLAFQQYSTWDLGGYLVSGVLLNEGVEAAKAYPVNDSSTYTDFMSETFSHELNTIGYDWKNFNMSTFQWELADSTVYFVRDIDGDVWRLIFTEFGGSANGNFIFMKEMISALSIDGLNQPMSFEMYPNPAMDYVSVVINAEESGTLQLIDLNGRVVYEQPLTRAFGVQNINVGDLESGMYIVRFSNTSGSITDRLIVK